MRNICIILLVLSLSVACTYGSGSSGPITESDTVSLTWKEIVQIEYDPATYQLGYNSSRNEYRVYDDRLAYWFVVTCSEKPVSEGQTLTADVSWTGKNKTKSMNALKFNVTKADDTGMVWLWNQANRISIVLKNQ